MECNERCSIVNVLEKQLNSKKHVDGYFMNLEKENKQLQEQLQAEQQRVEHLKNALFELNAMIIHGNTSNEKLGEVTNKEIHGLVTGRLNV